MPDEIKINILEDGVISVQTDSFSDANHVSADDLLDEITDQLGCEVERKKNTPDFFKNKQVLKGGKIVTTGG